MSEATARLPWHRGGRQTSYIYDADGKVVAESAGLEFVALIVHRVNAHDRLVEALEKIRDCWPDDEERMIWTHEDWRALASNTRDLAAAALAEAKP